MGRHRRSDAGRAATGRATGAAQTYGSYADGHEPHHSYPAARATLGTAPYLNAEAYAATNARSSAYLYATGEEPAGFGGGSVSGGTPRIPTQGSFGRGSSYGTQYGSPAPGPEAHDFAAHDYAARDFEAHDFFAHDYADDSMPVQDLTPGDPYADLADLGGRGGHGEPGDGFAPDGGPSRGGHRRRKKTVTPVRTGLLGVSAAVALGTVAVAAGVVPGLDNYRLGGGNSGGSDQVQAEGVPSNSATEQGGTSGSADPGTGTGAGAGSASAAGRDAGGSAAPAPSASTSSAPADAPSDEASTTAPAPKKPEPTPSRTASKTPTQTSAPVTVSVEAAAEAEVLKLVNEERAKVGCSALTANGSLGSLAEAFSKDMAVRDFFDHTDPDGDTPWDRASQAGISDLGGENIARGQADAAAVMDAWMNSPGHRANILNCDFKTLGVGVHYASGGPWWTQDFGY